MSETTPYHYQLHRYFDAERATRQIFGPEAIVSEPIKPFEDSPRTTPTIVEWTKDSAQKIGVNYAGFAHEAVIHIVQLIMRPTSKDIVFQDSASLRVPLEPIRTPQGDIPTGMLLDELELNAFNAGNEEYDKAQQGDSKRIFFPVGFILSAVAGEGLRPPYKHRLVQYSTHESWRSDTGLTLPLDVDPEVIALPSETEDKTFRRESSWYAYAAGLAHVALHHILENGPENVEMNLGTQTTLKKLGMISQRAYA